MSIQRLPAEILLEIFAVLPNVTEPIREKDWSEGIWVARSYSLNLLLDVCASWRRLALSSPRLWSEFVIDGPDLLGDNGAFVDEIRLWLERSGKSTISIEIYADEYPSDDIDDYEDEPEALYGGRGVIQSHYFAEILDVFFEHAQRWREVTLVLPAYGNDLFRREAPPDGAPFLEYLSISHLGDSIDGNLSDHRFERFLRSPKLRHFNWPTYGFGAYELEPHELPWGHSRLTNLELEECSLYGMLVILRRVPTLQTFSSYLTGCSQTKPLFHVEHQSLVELVIHGSYQANRFVDHLTLPTLQKLSINSTQSKYALTTFFSRSRCPLQSLQLSLRGENQAAAHDTISCLQEVADTLETLDLDPSNSESVYETIISSLTVPADAMVNQSCLLPRLTFLKICGKPPFDQLTKDMVISRCVMNLVHWEPKEPRFFTYKNSPRRKTPWLSVNDLAYYMTNLGPEHACVRAVMEKLAPGRLSMGDPKRFHDFLDDSSSLCTFNTLPLQCLGFSEPRMSIQQLPAEILLEIFAILPDVTEPYRDDYDDFGSEGIWSARSRALKLLLDVCATWRRLAISSPKLWSEFVVDGIDLLGDDGAHIKSTVDEIQLWLTRSGKSPISIEIRAHDYEIHDSSDDDEIGAYAQQQSVYFDDIFSIFFDHIHRWRELVLVLPSYSNWFPRKEMPVDGAPVLEHLSITYVGDFPILGNLSNHRFERLLRSPKLHYFNWPTNGLEGCRLNPYELPWGHCGLTEVEIEECSPYDILVVLKLTPTLRLFTSSFVTDYTNSQKKPLFHIGDHSLRTLNLAHTSSVEVDSIVEYLTLPALQELSFHSMQSTIFLPALTALFSRSRCPLQFLKLSTRRCEQATASALVDCLREVSITLKSLNLDLPKSERVYDMLFSSLTVPADAIVHRNCLVPRLTFLRVHDKLLSNQLIEDMVVSRTVMALVHWTEHDLGLFVFSDSSEPEKLWLRVNFKSYITNLGHEHECTRAIVQNSGAGSFRAYDAERIRDFLDGGSGLRP